MRTGMVAMVLGGIGLAAFVGCAEPAAEPAPAAAPESPEGAPTASNPDTVARVDIEPGHAVNFYEPSPGNLVVVETMAPGQKFVLAADAISDALRAYAQLRPQGAVPQALQAAYDRARSTAGDPTIASTIASTNGAGGGRPASAQPAAATPGVIQQALTESPDPANFVDNDGGCDWGPRFAACRVNWGGGFFAFSNPSTSGLCIVDHYAGNGVVIQVTAGTAITSMFQAVGTIAQYSLGASGPNVLRRVDVTNAAGDAFHVGCRFGV
jgi:hypothetical protein